MKPLPFTFMTLAVIGLSSALWSCNKDKSTSEAVGTRQAQQTEQPAPSSMPGAMPGGGSGMMEQLRAGCPMIVPGADVSASDTDGGVALAFTTDTGDVADLRQRVRHMAQMYGMHPGQAGMMWHHMGGGAMGHGPGMGSGHMGNQPMGSGGPGMGAGHMGAQGPMPAASATVTDTDKGARLELRPTDPSQLEALREHVRWHGERMHSGECWMLQQQSQEGKP